MKDLKSYILHIKSMPILVLSAWCISSELTARLKMEKINLFFEHFQSLPTWFTNLCILVVASIFGKEGTQIFRNGTKK